MATIPPNPQYIKQFPLLQAISQRFRSYYTLFTLTLTSLIQYQRLQFRKYKEEEATQAYFRAKGIKPCPKCTVPIELIAGCKFVTCLSGECRGGTYLCMQCGKHLPTDHAAHPCP